MQRAVKGSSGSVAGSVLREESRGVGEAFRHDVQSTKIHPPL